MRFTALAFLFSSCVSLAAGPALPSFSEKLPPTPVLSLSEAAKSGKMSAFEMPTIVSVDALRRMPPTQKRYVSRMPIIEPTGEVDRRMPVIAPETDVDFKLIIKEPKVDSVK